MNADFFLRATDANRTLAAPSTETARGNHQDDSNYVAEDGSC